MTSEKGLWDGNDATSFACVDIDENGISYAGATNGRIYMW